MFCSGKRRQLAAGPGVSSGTNGDVGLIVLSTASLDSFLEHVASTFVMLASSSMNRHFMMHQQQGVAWSLPINHSEIPPLFPEIIPTKHYHEAIWNSLPFLQLSLLITITAFI